VTDQVRIGCFAAFWGDTKSAAGQILRGSDVDYLVADYLAEITMALLARARAKNPDAGYVQDAIDTLVPHLAEIRGRGIKVVTNAGGLNPAGWAAAFREAAEAAGVPLRVAAVEGDDLLPRQDELLVGSPKDMFTGQTVPPRLSSINAYLGARPIAAALDAGADVVVTGRCVDAAVVLGPLMHEFGWSDNDYDLLAAGSLIGHIVECGPQCAGGIFTDWASVPGWEDMGYPVAECRPDGTAVITKPAGSGGLVSPATISEQIVYEIGDPGAYVMPDVVCDWRNVQLEQVGPDRVAVSGARGRAPTTKYKVTATNPDGYRAMTTAMFAGVAAGGRARRAGEALVARTERLLAERGFEPLAESSIEVVGAEQATEAVLKVGVRHEQREAVEYFAGEYAPMALVAQGMAGTFGGRPRPAPVIRVFHLLVDKDKTPVRITLDGEVIDVPIAPGSVDAEIGTPALDELPANDGEGITVPLHRLAYGRSGDKGNLANIGLIARRPEFTAILREQVTADRVAAFFHKYMQNGDGVRRWELPGISAINIVLPEVLGGTGGTSTLRYDPQGKSYAAMLLTLPVTVPTEWERDGRLAATEVPR
jgi:Acyclic terpene utilisation family protein AtuA